MSKTAEETSTCIYLHLSDAAPVEEQEVTLADGTKAKVLWKDILVEGSYPMSPGPGGATKDPMHVITDGESDASTKTIAMSDIEFAHRDGAFKYVTIPTKHRDDLLDNTGYVPRPDGLRRVLKHGKTVLQAALGFTEPDIKGKVQRGTIPDVSAGIFFNWTNKHTAKTYRCAMKHVSLTPTPFMGNLDGFAPVFASDDEVPDNTTIEVYEFADGENNSSGSGDGGKTGEIVWDETQAMNWIRERVQGALRPSDPPVDVPSGMPMTPRPYYWVQDVSSDKALVTEEYKGATTRFVIPFKIADSEVELAPQTRWVEVKEAMIAASDTPFGDVSADAIRTKLSDQLTQNFASETIKLSVEEVSLDHRVRIKNTDTGSEFVAQFAVDNGHVHIAPPDTWEQIKAPESKPRVPANISVTLSDVKMSRIDAARQRRRQLVAGNNPQKEV